MMVEASHQVVSTPVFEGATRRAKAGNGLIAALDAGSTKVSCFIAHADPVGGLTLKGMGHQVSRGVTAGAIVDMEAAEASIVAAVHAAEEMAGETVREVFLNLSAGRPASQTVGVEVALAGHEVGERDLERVLGESRSAVRADDRAVIHALPLDYSIDGNRGIRDPRGMVGGRLGVDAHIVTAAEAPVRNLSTCVARCHLDVAACVVSPYAAGLACLVPDEMDLGVTLVEMGGGTTGIAVFRDGDCVFTDMVALGGVHITQDVARTLSTPAAHAERMKSLFGSAVAGPGDEREMIEVPPVGEGEPATGNHVPRSVLVDIIRPRVEETFELVRSRLEAGGFHMPNGGRVVLAGGASQLNGIREVAGRILGKQVRMGQPIHVKGLAEATGGPAYATCAGLLAYAMHQHSEVSLKAWAKAERSRARFGRLGQWLREHF